MPHESDRSKREVAAVVGRSVKALREARGFTQRELADQAVRYLPTWTVNTVAATEVGRREPSLSEALALILIFDCTLHELLPLTAANIPLEPVWLQTAVSQATGERGGDLEAMRRIQRAMTSDSEYERLLATPDPTDWALARAEELGIELVHENFATLAALPPRPDGPGDPDKFAAKKFGLELNEIVEIAQRRYGHSLYVERWSRESALALLHGSFPPDYVALLPERTAKGRRIAISRSLFSEIEEEARALRAAKESK